MLVGSITGGTAAPFTLELRDGTGATGTLLYAASAGTVSSALLQEVTVPLSGPALAANATYSLVLRPTSATNVKVGVVSPGTYADGTAGVDAATQSFDLYLRLFGAPAGTGLVIAPSGITSDLPLRLPQGAAVSEFSTDGTLAGNADSAVPTEKAVKTYVDAALTSAPQPWTVAGANVYRAGGNVGIGTTAPANRLGVVSADNLPGTDIASFVAANGTAGVGLGWNGLRATGTNANGSLTLDGKGSGNLLLQTGGGTGNVGIGTTNPLSTLSLTPAAAGAKLTLFDNNGDATNHIGFGVSNSQLNYHVFNTSNDHVFYAGGKNGPGSGIAELFRVRGNGNVGIGTSAPATRLEVRGTSIGTNPNTLAPLGLLRLSRAGVSGQKYDAGFEVKLGSFTSGTESASRVDFNLGGGNDNNIDRTALTLSADGEVQVNGRLVMGAPIDRDIFIGFGAGLNTVRGGDANSATTVFAGTSNVLVGHGVGTANTNGAQNTLVGTGSGAANTTGNINVAVGMNAGATNTTGSANTFLGGNAGRGNDTGSLNTFVGQTAIPGRSGLVGATAIGARAQVDASNCLVLGAISGTNGAVNSTNVGIGVTAPTSRLEMNGAIAMPYDVALNGTYEYGINDYLVRFAPGSTGARLPDPSTCPGRIYVIWNLAGNNINISVIGGGNIVNKSFNAVTAIGNNSIWTIQSLGGGNWVITSVY